MLNQASRDALHSATYLEDYLDWVENLPADLQLCLTRLRELDIKYQGVLRELERRYGGLLENSGGGGGGGDGGGGGSSNGDSQRSKTLVSMQQSLIFLQEVADQKLSVLQNIHDLVDNKSRQLELDSKNLDYGSESVCRGSGRSFETGADSPMSPAAPCVTGASTDNYVSSGRGRRRQRRTRTSAVALSLSNIGDEAYGGNSDPGHEDSLTGGTTVASQTRLKNSRSSSAANSAANCATNSAGKRRRRNKVQQERDELPMEVTIDPDEPTYCLCEQVFFGEMIGCDNDLCPIEWFHFSCVNIVHKPKGKWFCPRCRGDRTNVMKPKHVFLKELQKYNKQKEEERSKKIY